MSGSGALELPFDQYQRYRLVADLLDEVRPKGKALAVLDVGGRTALLREFLPRDRVALVDLEPSREGGLVLGDGCRLPFRDEAFDVVCAFDTLEHVPPQKRPDFVRECARVARRHVAIAGPYDAPRVAEAERLLQRFLREKLRYEHRYLEEHRSNGLPGRAEVERELSAQGGEVATFGHGNVERWLFLMTLALYMDLDPALRGIAKAFHAFYNRALYDGDRAEPVYRHAVFASFDGAPLPKGPKGGAGELPASALSRLGELAGELAAFDREREAWAEERSKREKIEADLSADLDGHRKTLAEVSAERDEQEHVIEELEAACDRLDLDLAQEIAERARERGESEGAQAALAQDLDGHRRTLAALRAELARQQAGYGELLAEHERARAEHERALDEHRQVLADTRSELERTVEAARQFEAEWQRLEGIARSIQAELLRSNENASALAQELAEREAEIAALRAELRNRWRNLKRAASWRKPRF